MIEKQAFKRQEDFEQWLSDVAIELGKLKAIHERQTVSFLTRHADVIGRLTVHQADAAFLRLNREHLITEDEWKRVRLFGRSDMPAWLFSRPLAISTKTWVELPEAARVKLRNPNLEVQVRRMNQVVMVRVDKIKDQEWKRIIWPSDPKAGIRPIDMRSGNPRSRAPEYYNEASIVQDPQFPSHIIIAGEHRGKIVRIRVSLEDHMRRLRMASKTTTAGAAS